MNPAIAAFVPLIQSAIDAVLFPQIQSWIDEKVHQPDQKIVADAFLIFVKAVVAAELKRLAVPAAPKEISA